MKNKKIYFSIAIVILLCIITIISVSANDVCDDYGHRWVNGNCTECGIGCTHQNWDGDYCRDCGIYDPPECTHSNIVGNTCSDCGTYIPSEEVHSHFYNQKNTSSEYLKSSATCTSAAVYYYSCECGEIGTSTFISGSNLSHVYDQRYTSSVYLKSSATCTSPAEYYYSCECGAKSVSTFSYGLSLGHNFNEVYECTECNYACPHTDMAGNICSECGYFATSSSDPSEPCTHSDTATITVPNGDGTHNIIVKCLSCHDIGQETPNISCNLLSGACPDCGYECSHQNVDGDLCLDCGLTGVHMYIDGVCIYCYRTAGSLILPGRWILSNALGSASGYVTASTVDSQSARLVTTANDYVVLWGRVLGVSTSGYTSSKNTGDILVIKYRNAVNSNDTKQENIGSFLLYSGSIVSSQGLGYAVGGGVDSAWVPFESGNGWHYIILDMSELCPKSWQLQGDAYTLDYLRIQNVSMDIAYVALVEEDNLIAISNYDPDFYIDSNCTHERCDSFTTPLDPGYHNIKFMCTACGELVNEYEILDCIYGEDGYCIWCFRDADGNTNPDVGTEEDTEPTDKPDKPSIDIKLDDIDLDFISLLFPLIIILVVIAVVFPGKSKRRRRK